MTYSHSFNFPHWRRYFSASFTHRELHVHARVLINNFMKGVADTNFLMSDDMSANSHRPDLDAWVQSIKGQALLLKLVTDLQEMIEEIGQYALPAHDKRQILGKDAIEALRFWDNERPEGYKSLMVIATFAHDIGRLFEGRLFDPDLPIDQWVPHAQLSFLLLNDLLSGPEYAQMPFDIKRHLLYGVLGHSGPDNETYIGRAIQSCDRTQLHEEEGFFRALSFMTCVANGTISYPKDPKFSSNLVGFEQLESAMMVIEFFARNMRPCIGENHGHHRDEKMIHAVALMMKYAEGHDDITSIMFAPEIQPEAEYGFYKHMLSPELLEAARRLADQYPSDPAEISAHDVFTMISEDIEKPQGAAPLSPMMRERLKQAVLSLNAVECVSLRNTIMMARRFRTEQDMRDVTLAQDILARSNNPICCAIARKALDYLPPLQRDVVYQQLPDITLVPDAALVPHP